MALRGRSHWQSYGWDCKPYVFPVATAQSRACHTALLQSPQSGTIQDPPSPAPKKPAGPIGPILVLATPSRDKVAKTGTLLQPGKVSRTQEQTLDGETGRKEQSREGAS